VVNGFGKITFRAQFHAVPHARAVGKPGHQNKRDRRRHRLAAQRGQRVITVHLAHVDVAKDEVGQFLARPPDAIAAVGGFDDFKSALPKCKLQSSRATTLRRL